MKTQDGVQVQGENIDKLFMASHGTNKYPNVISNSSANQYNDGFIPYYKDKEVTYWSMNLEKSNFYRSHTQGINAFSRSSGFTQPVHQSKAVNQYHGNVSNNKEAKFVYTNEFDDKFVNNYKESANNKGKSEDLMPSIKGKLIIACRKNGWIGMRKLRTFLRNLSKKKSDMINKVNFKYYLTEFGVVVSDAELASIFKIFDIKCKDEINFMHFLDSLIDNNENRSNAIADFASQYQLEDKVCFKTLQKNIDFNFHPEVISFRKTSMDVNQEYIQSWDNLKENNMIFVNNFVRYFNDISLSVESDEDFFQILRCCGYKC